MSIRILVVGSINTDEAIRLTRLPGPGETVGAKTATIALGGKGANQAVAAARAGASVRMLGAVGADGAARLSELQADGIDTRDVAALAGTPTGRAIVLVDDGAENAIVVVPGANHAIPDAAVARACAEMRPGDVLLLQHEVPAATSRLAARAARAAGATVILNAAPAPTTVDDIIDEIDVLIVNEHELATIAALLGLGGDSVDARIGAVAARLGTDVVCTLGAAGAAFRVGAATGRAPAPRVVAVDTTAAGDTFVGHLAAAWTLPFADRLTRALTAGSLAVTRPGAASSIPTRSDVDTALAPASPHERTRA